MIQSWRGAERERKEVKMALETEPEKSENSFKFAWDVRLEIILFLVKVCHCLSVETKRMLLIWWFNVCSLLMSGIQSWAFLQWKISASASLLDQRSGDDKWREWWWCQTRSYSQTHSVNDFPYVFYCYGKFVISKYTIRFNPICHRLLCQNPVLSEALFVSLFRLTDLFAFKFIKTLQKNVSF